MSRWLTLLAVVAGAIFASAPSTNWLVAQDASAPDAEGMREYLRGIDALHGGDYTSAADSFSTAIDADEENPDFFTARGVARTLAEDFAKAIKDFERSLRLRDGDFETTLWMSAAYFMNDQAEKGSYYFNHGPQAMHDYAGIVHDMARTYMTSRYRGSYYDMAQRKNVKADGPVRTGFARAAAEFAGRRKSSGGAVSKTTLEQARKLFDQREYRRAFDDLDLVLQSSPDDFDVLSYHARAALELGDVITARRELTRVLTLRIDWADGYAARARAAAEMGNVKRAEMDSQIARRLGVDAPRLDVKPTTDPHEALAQLLDAAKSGASSDELADLALEVIRATEPARKRYDETYQDQLRELTEATRTIPPSANSFAALAEFLYTHAATVRGEKVEPRAAFTSYRVLTDASQNAEITAAEQAADAALAIDARQVTALAYKSACLMWRLNWSGAEETLQRALDINNDDPRVLSMMARVLDHAAQVKSAEAGRMRATETWEDMTYIYWRYPSPAELAQADEYDAQARRIWDLAQKHLSQAAQATRGAAESFYFEGILQLRQRNVDAARDAFEQTVKIKPEHVESREQLATIYSKSGQLDKAIEEQSSIANLFHTSAGPMLRLAWTHVPRTAWKSAKAAIARAQEIDPVDARCQAYLARIAEGQENTEQARIHYRAALALLEARERLGEKSVMELAVRMHLGQLLQKAGQIDESLSVYQINCDAQSRILDDALTLPAPAAMLPDPALPATEFPIANAPAYYIAWSHVGAGQTMMKMNQVDEAEKHFVAAQELENSWPPTRQGRNQLLSSSAWARLDLCRILHERGDNEQAFRLMTREGWPWDLPDELESQVRQLRDQITEARQRGN